MFHFYSPRLSEPSRGYDSFIIMGQSRVMPTQLDVHIGMKVLFSYIEEAERM